MYKFPDLLEEISQYHDITMDEAYLDLITSQSYIDTEAFVMDTLNRTRIVLERKDFDKLVQNVFAEEYYAKKGASV